MEQLMMPPEEHKKFGYGLWVVREQMLSSIGLQFQYIQGGILRNKIKTRNNKAISDIDDVRDFLSGVAYQDLEGQLPYIFYYPGSREGITIPDLLTGVSNERAVLFSHKSRYRDNLCFSKQAAGIIDSEDGHTLIEFYNTILRDILSKLTIYAERWPDKQKSTDLKRLCEKAKTTIRNLAYFLQYLQGGLCR